MFPSTPALQQKIASMLRVNVAGEYGAKRIYEGQLAVLKTSSSTEVIEHMKNQELAHLKAFEEQLVKHRARPTLLQPLWHVAGYALGAATAFLGEKAAMACTVAVEEVIDQHYEKQLADLGSDAPELSQLILICQQEELEHRDIAFEYGACQAYAYPLLSHAIKSATRLAIWLSERI